MQQINNSTVKNDYAMTVKKKKKRDGKQRLTMFVLLCRHKY